MNQDSILKPSLFTGHPWNSIFQNAETEQIALNIMLILKRNGDKFLFPEEMTWEMYKEERLKDGQFPEAEQSYFEKVKYLSTGVKSTILNFSPDWSKAYISAIENELSQHEHPKL